MLEADRSEPDFEGAGASDGQHIPIFDCYLRAPVLPKPNKGGRPATGRDPATAIRLSEEFRAAVDKWAAKQDDHPARSEAIRRLVELGLKGKK